MAKIIIHNLGVIKNLELNIEQFNLLIGEQATGKSTICKAIYFFRDIKNQMIDYLYRIALNGREPYTFPKSLNKHVKDIFIQLFGYSWQLPSNLNMQYCIDSSTNLQVTLRRMSSGKNFICIEYSDRIIHEMCRLEQMAVDFYGSSSRSGISASFMTNENLRLHQEIVRNVNLLFSDVMETYYIPAGRSLLTLMSMQRTKLDYDTIDLVNRRFMQFIETIQPKFDMGIGGVHKYYPDGRRKFDAVQMADKLIESFKGDYIYKNGREYFIAAESREEIPINFVSSGQQEILWLLNQIYVLLLKK